MSKKEFEVKKVLFLMFVLLNFVLADGFVTVYGNSNLTLSPNSAVLNLDIYSDGGNLLSVKEKNDKITKKTNDLLKEQNISKSSIQIQRAFISSRDKYNKNGEAVGKIYSVSKNAKISINDINKTHSLIDALISAGISNINISYENNEIKTYENKALKEALNLARQKALKLAEASNKELGEIIEVEELSANSQNYFMNAKSLNAADSFGNLDGVISVGASVKAKFNLK